MIRDMTTYASPEPFSAPLPWNLAAAGYTDVLMPWFSRYALDALALAGVAAPAAVLDVASGPGTLSLLAAERGLQVTAVDFAQRMLEGLRESARSRGLPGVAAVLADGESLPFADGSFDAGFSMFGILFFPDPARGLGELLRVLKPEGRAVVSTWQPLEETPFLVEMISVLAEEIESFSFPEDELSQPGELESAMTAAGFIDVVTREATYSLECASLDDALERLMRSTVPFPLLRQRLSESEWNRIWAGVRVRLAERFGEGAQVLRYPAWLAGGRKPRA
jgi:ubiquinone/menaquinone biosynthesis C-methylase UbiE